MASVNLPKPYLDRLLFQLQYSEGYRYLDRCGQTLVDILDHDPLWAPSAVNPQQGRLTHLERSLEFSFSSGSLELSLKNDDDPKDFQKTVLPLVQIVQRNIAFGAPIRAGLRAWFLLAHTSEEEAKRFLKKKNFITISKKITNCVDLPLDTQSFILVFEDEKQSRGRRLAITPQKRESGQLPPEILKKSPRSLPKNQRKAFQERLKAESQYRKDPRYAVLCDVDCYVHDPEMGVLEEFIKQSIEDCYNVVETIRK